MENEVKQVVETALNDFKSTLKQYATAEDMNKALDIFKAEFNGVVKSEDIAKLEKAIETQGALLASLEAKKQPTEPKTIKEQLEAQKDVLAKIAAGDRTVKTTVLPTSITSNQNGMFLPGIGQIQTREPMIHQLFAQSGIGANNHRVIRYTDQSSITNNAASRTVGAQAGESAIAWTGYNLNIESYSHFIPVAKEMLSDFDFVQSEINNTLLRYLMLSVESAAYSGDGTSPDIKGVLTSATAWSDPGVDFAKATVIDLIQSISAGISTNSMFKANYVLMNNIDSMKLQLTKDADGQYILPAALTQGGIAIGSIKVIPTSLVATNTLLVGDFNWGTFYSKSPIIEIGYNGTDFSERQVSIMANMDCALLVKSVNAGSFVKVNDVATAIATITE